MSSPRYVRIPRDQAKLHDTPWDELPLRDLPGLGIDAIQLLCQGWLYRGKTPDEIPEWHGRCRHSRTYPIDPLIAASGWARIGRLRQVFRCSKCGAYHPSLIPLRRTS